MDIVVSEPQIIAYDEEIYSSFPDIVAAPNGDLICVYREGDTHHPTISKIVLMFSNDQGKTWKRDMFEHVSLEEHGFVFNCPRISIVHDKLAIVTDTKTSQKEGKAKWDTFAWWSSDFGKTWSGRQSLNIHGAVPDKIITLSNKLVIGYHIGEVFPLFVTGKGIKKRLAQMMAESYDGGETWRDRTTIAVEDAHSFCEGTIVNVEGDKLICYLRDNKNSHQPGCITSSMDSGKTWTTPIPLHFRAHRIVAAKKLRDPYQGSIIGTFRNTANKTVGLFVHDLDTRKIQIFSVDTETKNHLFDFGYTGWVELNDGSLMVVYYICRENPNPEICMVRVKLV